MSEHIVEWLGAYHDGELRGARLRQIEEHLAGCAECQTRLDELQGLSALLHEAVPSAEFLPTGRFVDNLMLNLPRQSTQPQKRKVSEIAWWLIPAGLLGAWSFLQITFWLSSVFMTASNSGLLGSGLAWLQGSPYQTQWFAAIMNLTGGHIDGVFQPVLVYLNNSDAFLWNLAGQIELQVLIAVLYLGWLGAWWLRSHQPSMEPGIFSQS